MLHDTNKNLTQESIHKFLDWSYEQTITGLPGQKNVYELVDDYLSKYDTEIAIKKLVNSQKAKATTSGFITGFGGVLTMPITIPANVASVILVQMRMIASIAVIRGYDLKSDQVQTFVYVSLAGTTISDIGKRTGIVIGNKMAMGVVQKIPGKVLTKINQAVGFRLITKFGTKGAINLGKAVPIVGAFVGGGFDLTTTTTIAKVANKTFTNNGFSMGNGTILDKK